MQHALAVAGRLGQGSGGQGPRPLRSAVQHGRRVGRHVHGHEGHDLLPTLSRDHRGQHRDGHGCSVLRRAGDDSWVRQEHAGLRHGDDSDQPAELDALWRNYRLWPVVQGRPVGHRFYVRGLRQIHFWRHRRSHAGRRRAARMPRARRLWRHVYCEHDGLRGGGARPLLTLQLFPACGVAGEGGRMRGHSQGDAQLVGTQPEAVGHPDEEVVRERDRRGERLGRLHERGASPSGTCGHGRHRPGHR
mmetsp:Transcript_35972/g.103450  ORF Transcript_35972/g.103450 Transcript_35972/m.103450 type:complete len:246 (+) Transcript_35972:237-974(+)